MYPRIFGIETLGSLVVPIETIGAVGDPGTGGPVRDFPRVPIDLPTVHNASPLRLKRLDFSVSQVCLTGLV
ncbi:hypothetical protein [Nocardia alba]|uniref:hypothetical protein n=1 Tax=Nocardia alba TaxID=225051 RepID=UPI001A9DBEA9|nr:hypothetical protein [Nocardia alba]